MHGCTTAYMCVYCLWWGEQEENSLEKASALFLSIQFADPLNRGLFTPEEV